MSFCTNENLMSKLSLTSLTILKLLKYQFIKTLLNIPNIEILSSLYISLLKFLASEVSEGYYD